MAGRGSVAIFGAGNIGRGLLGQLVASAGLHPVFIEAAPRLADELRARGSYRVELVGRSPQRATVEDYSVLTPDETGAIAGLLAGAQFAATAVGGANLGRAAELMAPGLGSNRPGPLNILVCENWPHADQVLAEALQAQGAPPSSFSCVGCSVERMVRPLAGSLDLTGESGQAVFIDAQAWRGDRPAVDGFEFTDSLDTLYARKVYTNNAGHALLAYRGALLGLQYLYEALAVPQVHADLTEFLALSASALEQHYGLAAEGLRRHVDDLVRHRFANRPLADTVCRVARQPLRKLGPDERLVGLARVQALHGLPTRATAGVIGAALHYADPADDEAQELQRRIRSEGAAAILESVCKLRPDDPCFRECLAAYEGLEGLARSRDRYATPGRETAK